MKLNIKVVIEPLRNSQETPSTQILIILRNFQFWPKFLVSYKRNLFNISRTEKAVKLLCDNPALVEERGYPSLEKEEILRNG